MKSDNDENFKSLVSARGTVMNLRGLVIDVMVTVEHHLGELIALHYCGTDMEKRKEFIHTVVSKDGFSLNFKYGLLGYIVRNFYPDVLENDKEFLNDFGKLIEFRNHVAHRVFRDGDGNDDKLTLKYFKTEGNKIKVKDIALSKVIVHEKMTRAIEIGEFIRDKLIPRVFSDAETREKSKSDTK